MAETALSKKQLGSGIWTEDSLIAGNNISITQVEKPVIDENTIELYHFDDSVIDSISSNSWTSDTLSYSDGKFTKALYALNAWRKGTPQTTLSYTQSFTIDFWVKRSEASGEAQFCLNSSASSYIDFTDNYIAVSNDISSSSIPYPNSQPISNTEWHHFALVNDTTTGKMYAFWDGIKALEKQTSTSFINEGFYGLLFYIVIDELRISNIARWTSDFTPYSQPYAAAGATQYQINNTQDISSKQDALTTATGYDATKTQVLKNVNGTLTWVDEA